MQRPGRFLFRWWGTGTRDAAPAAQGGIRTRQRHLVEIRVEAAVCTWSMAD